MYNWYVIIFSLFGPINDQWRFNEIRRRLQKKGITGPWSVDQLNIIHSTLLLSKEEAIQKYFINEEGKLLYWGFPGTGNVQYNIFGFNDDEDALNFALLAEKGKIGII